jgi:peptide/nickel transport system substrate-binding protein
VNRVTRMRLGALAAAIVMSATLAACGGSDSDEPADGGTPAAQEKPTGGPFEAGASVSIRLAGDYDNINPATMVSYSASILTAFMYDRLVALDENGDPVPWLAESWEEVSPTETTFKLRADATCTSGEKVTPSLVKDSMDYFTNPETFSAYPPLTFGPEPVKIAADDAAGTITFTTATPFPDMLVSLAAPGAGIICPGGLKDPEALKTGDEGSGPYDMTEAKRGDSYTLTKRADYTWGPEGSDIADLPDTVVFKVVDNDTTAANLLTSGGLNIAYVDGRDAERLLSNDEFFKASSDLYGTDPLVMNQQKGLPGTDAAVRRAVMMAVDAEGLNQAKSFGRAKVVNTVVTPNMTCYDEAVGAATPAGTIEEAQAVLEEAGYAKNADGIYEKDGKKLTLRIAGSELQNAGPEYIRTKLEELGVDAKLSVSDHATFVNVQYATGEWDVLVWSMSFLYPSPWLLQFQMGGPAPPDGFNVPNIQNKESSELALQALEATGDESCTLWQESEKKILEAADAKPIATNHHDWFGTGASFKVDLGILVDPFSLRSTK